MDFPDVAYDHALESTLQVSVTLTLSSQAAEDIGGVLSAIADLLKIAVPPSYEVSRSPSPDFYSLARAASARRKWNQLLLSIFGGIYLELVDQLVTGLWSI